MEERKGFLTPEQEKILDNLIQFNNKLAEKVDGFAIRLIDDKGLERLKKEIEEKHPGAKEIIYQVVDTIFEVLEQIKKE
jgi:hypothetical protein